jgi:hypothetical protein
VENTAQHLERKLYQSCCLFAAFELTRVQHYFIYFSPACAPAMQAQLQRLQALAHIDDVAVQGTKRARTTNSGEPTTHAWNTGSTVKVCVWKATAHHHRHIYMGVLLQA